MAKAEVPNQPRKEAGPTLPTQAESGGIWTVYLLECADGTYYCGVAKHLDSRLDQHNGLKPGGAKYTRSRRPVKLVASRACDDKKSAYSLEYAVKAVPRAEKLDFLLSGRTR